MRDWVRQLPITVGVPVAIALATVPPSAIGSVFSEYRQLVTPDVANWGLGVALIFAALYSPFAFQQRTSSLAAPEVAAPTAPILSKLPEPDEWVQNAVRLIVWGQWKAPIDGPISDVQASNVLHEASRCLVGIRQLVDRI